MRGKQMWGALLATCTVLVPGLAFGQSIGLPFGQSGEDYAPPDTVFPLPLSSTHPEAGGLFIAGGFWFERQTNPIKTQPIAVRGFTTTNSDVLSTIGATTLGTTAGVMTNGAIGKFVGDRLAALNTQQVAGPESYQPGFDIETGWKFSDGQAITIGFRRLTETSYAAVATVFPQNLQVGSNLLQNSFLSAPVYNFPVEFNGPINKVQSGVQVIPQFTITTTIITPGSTTTTNGVATTSAPTTSTTTSIATTGIPGGFLLIPASAANGGVTTIQSSVQNPGTQGPLPSNNGAAGIWNGATSMAISFLQRFTDYYLNYRVPVVDTECYRLNGMVGPRATWIWEEFKWRTVDVDVFGQSGPTSVGVYSNIDSNYMYGVFIGCEQEWYWGNGFAGMLDTRITGYVDVVKEVAKYQLGDRELIANKRARKDYTFVPEAEATLSLMWYPIEGVQIKLGYNVMAFLNTISSPEPIDFNYGSLTPTYVRTFRLFDGFQAAISFSF